MGGVSHLDARPSANLQVHMHLAYSRISALRHVGAPRRAGLVGPLFLSPRWTRGRNKLHAFYEVMEA